MNGERQAEWIVVRDFDELFVGCCIRFLCGWCGGIHVGNVVSQVERRVALDDGSEVFCAKTSVLCRGRRPHVRDGDSRMWITDGSVKDGEVERLRPDAPAASDETSRPAKVRETVRAGR